MQIKTICTMKALRNGAVADPESGLMTAADVYDLRLEVVRGVGPGSNSEVFAGYQSGQFDISGVRPEAAAGINYGDEVILTIAPASN